MAYKFYRNVIEVEVLTECCPLKDLLDVGFDLEDVHRLITFGEASGCFAIKESVEVSPEKMEELLIAQGSDPEFFGLGDDDDDRTT